MANSLAYMAKAKLILNKEKHWFCCFSSYCYWYRLSILICLLKYISKISVSSLPDRALKTHGVFIETNLTALTGDENKTEGAVVVLAEQLYQTRDRSCKSSMVWDWSANVGGKPTLLSSSLCLPFIVSVYYETGSEGKCSFSGIVWLLAV